MMLISNKMTAMTVSSYGKNPVAKIQMPVPSIGDNDVLVKVHSASVNPVDFKIRNGDLKLILPLKFPLILGNDLAGVVVAVGKNVKNFIIGDEVFGRIDKVRANNEMSGTFAQFVAISAINLAKKPVNLDFNQSASLPLVALTAYQAFTERMNVKVGDKVLIHAGAGGLGSIAIQIAKNLGLVVATTASGKGLDIVKSLRADEIIDYKNDEFTRLKDFDAVLDTIGGDTLEKSFQVLKSGGKVVSVSGMPTTQFADEWGLAWWKKLIFGLITRKLHKIAKQHNATYEFLFMHPSGEQLQIIKNWVEDGKLMPVIDKVFVFADTQKTLDYQETGRAKGKVVISDYP